MKNLVAFFEIPAVNIQRAANFYGSILGLELEIMDFGHEKMAFFPKESGKYPGAISYARGFNPSESGLLLSFYVDKMETALNSIENNGGKVTLPKTKIEADDQGYFSIFIDSEGNKVGLYSDK